MTHSDPTTRGVTSLSIREHSHRGETLLQIWISVPWTGSSGRSKNASTRAGCRSSRAVRKLLAADDAGPSVRAVVERATFVKLNEVAPTRLRTVFRNVDPATAKQIADECGGDSLRAFR